MEIVHYLLQSYILWILVLQCIRHRRKMGNCAHIFVLFFWKQCQGRGFKKMGKKWRKKNMKLQCIAVPVSLLQWAETEYWDDQDEEPMINFKRFYAFFGAYSFEAKIVGAKIQAFPCLAFDSCDSFHFAEAFIVDDQCVESYGHLVEIKRIWEARPLQHQPVCCCPLKNEWTPEMKPREREYIYTIWPTCI